MVAGAEAISSSRGVVQMSYRREAGASVVGRVRPANNVGVLCSEVAVPGGGSFMGGGDGAPGVGGALTAGAPAGDVASSGSPSAVIGAMAAVSLLKSRRNCRKA
jgi:hypothetical protein